jgi:hypothetical protein
MNETQCSLGEEEIVVEVYFNALLHILVANLMIVHSQVEQLIIDEIG